MTHRTTVLPASELAARALVACALAARVLAACVLAVCVLAACTIAPTELSRRYATAGWTELEGEPPHITLAVQSHAPPEHSEPPLFFQVDGVVQSKLLDLLGAQIKDAEELMLELTRPRPVDPPSVIDRTVFHRRLLFTVQKNAFDRGAGSDRGSGRGSVRGSAAGPAGAPAVGPADRISRLQLTLELENAVFDGWDRFESEYGEVDLARISSVQTRFAQGSLDVGPGQGARLPISANVTGGVTQTLAEEVALRRRFEVLTPILEADRVRLVREGVFGIDLSGNSALAVRFRWSGPTVTAAVVRLHGLRRGVDPERVFVDRSYVVCADRAGIGDIAARASARYEMRRVVAGAATFSEHDDDVEFVVGQTPPQRLTLVDVAELEVFVYGIETADDGMVELEQFGLLRFASYEEARAFLDWARNADWSDDALVLGGRRLRDTADNTPLTRSDLAGLRLSASAMN